MFKKKLTNNIYISELKTPTSEIMVMILEERCRKTLYHIGVGLNCFQYFKDPNDKCRKKNNVVCYECLISRRRLNSILIE